VTFTKNASIRFGSGGGATLNIGTDGDLVTFGAKASLCAGGTGNTYTLGNVIFFKPGQPSRHNI
jgi:hypothetical protein